MTVIVYFSLVIKKYIYFTKLKRYLLICFLQCKNVITKIQRKIDKEGQLIIPLLTDLWKKAGSPGSSAGNRLLDLRKIELRVDQMEYNGVMDLIADVQFMLKGGMQYFGFSHEV